MRPSGCETTAYAECPLRVGGSGGWGTPGPIPNPEVKPPRADGTADESVGEQGAADPQATFENMGTLDSEGVFV